MEDEKILDEILENLRLDEIQCEVKEISLWPCIKVRNCDILKCLYVLRHNPKIEFTILSDLFAADFPGQKQRFEVGYNLLSTKLNMRLIIKTCVSEGENLDSVTKVYSSAGWYEREVFDLFGINFNNHPDLRRILTDYNFEGHPLRKDFPLTGYVQVKYDTKEGKVVYEPVALDQDYREFEYVSPWK